MIGLVICGHGTFASGLLKAMHQIVGTQDAVAAIDFHEAKTTAQLTTELKAALEAVDRGKGVVYLTDILGGTPFRVASTIALFTRECEVITGTNLQLLVEMVLERDVDSVATFRDQALACGHHGLTSLTDEMEKKSFIVHSEEGI